MFHQNYSRYVLLTKREVKVAGFCITRPIFSHFDEQAWSLKDLLYGQKKFNARDSVPRKKTRKKTRAGKMGSLARDSFISNYTNTASHLPI